MRTVVVVQARMGSSRLPGKSLRALQGRPLIAHVVERARAIKGVDQVLVATSVTDADRALADVVDRLGVDVYCGSEWDVLGRMRAAAEYARADLVVRVTGDCPLLAPDVAETVLAAYRASPLQCSYITNDTARSGFPDGTDVEVFAMDLLAEADRRATVARDREHVTPWMRRTVTWGTVRSDEDWSRLKLSVDHQSDLDRVATIVQFITPGDLTLAATIRGAQRARVL